MATGLRYASLKAQASIGRAVALLISGVPNPHPDETFRIPSRDQGRTIKAYIYRPSNSSKPGPVLINFHGSGFILPRHGEDDIYCRRISSEAGLTVVDASYRLAPEHPFPAAIHDTEDVVRYILGQPEVYDLRNVFISGSSAGGNLALTAAATIFPKDTFRAAISFYPVADVARIPSTRAQPDQSLPAGISPFTFKVMFDCYLQDPKIDRKDPLVSPQWASTDALPDNLMILTAAGDTLCSEGEDYAEKCRQGGKTVVTKRFEGVTHAWDNNPKIKPGSVEEQRRTEAYGMVVDFLRNLVIL